jgi:aspartyl-tRNA(Asn)/glutamyl-tRNA(Gln) amidotransferase subunit C
MSLVTKPEILKLAQMSRIAINENEIDTISAHINGVLTYAARVSEIAQKQQGEIIEPQNSNIFREDTVVPSNAERLLDAAPVHEADYFVVPAILGNEE